MFRRAMSFLGDSLGKVNKYASPIRTVGKALDSLGVGGGRIGGFLERGLGLADAGARSLKEFGEMTPEQQSKRLGALAGAAGGGLIDKGLRGLGADPRLSSGISRGLGQLGGSFLSGGLRRLLG